MIKDFSGTASAKSVASSAERTPSPFMSPRMEGAVCTEAVKAVSAQKARRDKNCLFKIVFRVLGLYDVTPR